MADRRSVKWTVFLASLVLGNVWTQADEIIKPCSSSPCRAGTVCVDRVRDGLYGYSCLDPSVRNSTLLRSPRSDFDPQYTDTQNQDQNGPSGDHEPALLQNNNNNNNNQVPPVSNLGFQQNQQPYQGGPVMNANSNYNPDYLPQQINNQPPPQQPLPQNNFNQNMPPPSPPLQQPIMNSNMMPGNQMPLNNQPINNGGPPFINNNGPINNGPPLNNIPPLVNQQNLPPNPNFNPNSNFNPNGPPPPLGGYPNNQGMRPPFFGPGGGGGGGGGSYRPYVPIENDVVNSGRGRDDSAGTIGGKKRYGQAAVTVNPSKIMAMDWDKFTHKNLYQIQYDNFPPGRWPWTTHVYPFLTTPPSWRDTRDNNYPNYNQNQNMNANSNNGEYFYNPAGCASSPCQNNGECTSVGLYSYKCSCTFSYYGHLCQHRNFGSVLGVTLGTIIPVATIGIVIAVAAVCFLRSRRASGPPKRIR